MYRYQGFCLQQVQASVEQSSTYYPPIYKDTQCKPPQRPDERGLHSRAIGGASASQTPLHDTAPCARPCDASAWPQARTSPPPDQRRKLCLRPPARPRVEEEGGEGRQAVAATRCATAQQHRRQRGSSAAESATLRCLQAFGGRRGYPPAVRGRCAGPRPETLGCQQDRR